MVAVDPSRPESGLQADGAGMAWGDSWHTFGPLVPTDLH